MVQHAQGQLFEVVVALHSSGGLTRRLHRRQQQRNQDADDRNHHKQLDKSKTVLVRPAIHLIASDYLRG